MSLDGVGLQTLVNRSTALGERLAGVRPTAAGNGHPVTDSVRLIQWCDRAARGDYEAFARRLDWDGHDLSHARSALEAPRHSSEPAQPWVYLLDDALAAARRSGQLASHSAIPGDRAIRKGEPVPFAEILLPIVTTARRRLRAVAGDAERAGLSDEALSALEHGLLQQLSHLCEPTLRVALGVFQARHSSGWLAAGSALWNGAGPPDDFTAHMLQSGLEALLEEHSALARLLATRVSFWIEATAELLQRLASDRRALDAGFGSAGPLGSVLGVQADLSDSHSRGRTVSVLTFESGTKVVYKPRNIAMERVFNELLEWINQRAPDPALRTLRVLDRGAYGWVEFAAAQDCNDSVEVERYYHRAGRLLCLAHALGAGDLHRENVVASGEHPVLIDLEVLMTPRRTEPRFGESKYWLHALRLRDESVLRTLLLPYRQVTQKGMTAEGGGLGAMGSALKRGPSGTADNGNHTERTVNLPVLHGRPIPAGEQQTALIAGFTDMYRFLMDRKQELLGADSPFTAFADQPVRIILRPTAVYRAALNRALHPNFLKEGIDRSIELETLRRPVLWTKQKPVLWAAYGSEQQELERGDVPICHTSSTSRDLHTGCCGTIADFAENSGYEESRARVAALDPEDLERQVQFIRVALTAYPVLPRVRPATTEAAEPKPDLVDGSEHRAGEEARLLAEELIRLAIHGANGSATWVALLGNTDPARCGLHRIEEDLWSGRTGIALFFAALDAVAGGGYRAMARSTLQPLIRGLDAEDYGEGLAQRLGIGGARGLGGIAHALCRSGELLGDGELLEAAFRIGKLITPERIAADADLDVFTGSAGALLGLLTLYDACPDAELLERAVACSHHLLAKRVQDESTQYRAWPSPEGHLASGFAHGAAGIAYALVRLHQYTGNQLLLDAAAESYEFERGLFDAAAGNWWDHSSASQGDEASPAKNAWCHGAAGIGLARLASSGTLRTETSQRDIDAAIKAVGEGPLEGPDHLCCGAFGIIELLLTASQRLARPDLLHLARRRADEIVVRSNGIYRLASDNGFSPYFFQGWAGLGYQLLRLWHPDRLRSVLLWE